MPLSEFLRLAVEKLEAGKRKQSSTDLSSRSESNLGSPTPQLDLSRNDEIIPWFSYSVNNGPQNYGSEFLSEISGVTANVMSTQNSSVFGNCSHDDRDVVKESVISAKTENLCGEISIKNDRALEPVVDSSSVGSDNSANRVSCGQKRNSKRNFRDIEETISDDIGTELIGVTKATTAGGRTAASKRSRVAEVHNLSERRRRDRINEKMRALQELIPNCNKADKASMLDEAIEYLKNLQLQIQIMSMRAGLCMPPHMIFAQGNRHLYRAHLPHHFSPIMHPMQRALFPSSAPGPTYRGHHSTSPKFDSRYAVENKNSECMHNTEANT